LKFDQNDDQPRNSIHILICDKSVNDVNVSQENQVQMIFKEFEKDKDEGKLVNDLK
jgi:hypothetical protein